ncbi:MAG: SAM-dependent methyltransferase [Lachnospiraceae bacterium]|nr:SAM-dependent methyltransferase [Lachnospiraceae bacterium]
MRLSDRLESIIEMVPEGEICADIGCDHGFTSIELIGRGISPKVVASDLREGPLASARENIKNAGLEDKIKLMISDGFDAYEPGEVSTAVIAGMGGVLIKDMLVKGIECVSEMGAFVVQPQSNIPEFRNFLRLNGYEIEKNAVVLDAGKYYFPMRIRYTGKDASGEDPFITAEDRYGADLIRENRGLSDYLDFQMESYEKISERLLLEDGVHDDRTLELKSLMELNRSIRSKF